MHLWLEIFAVSFQPLIHLCIGRQAASIPHCNNVLSSIECMTMQYHHDMSSNPNHSQNHAFLDSRHALQCPCNVSSGSIFHSVAVLTGAQDKDANTRVKAVGIVGSAAANTSLGSQHSHAELLMLLTQRSVVLAY